MNLNETNFINLLENRKKKSITHSELRKIVDRNLPKNYSIADFIDGVNRAEDILNDRGYKEREAHIESAIPNIYDTIIIYEKK